MFMTTHVDNNSQHIDTRVEFGVFERRNRLKIDVKFRHIALILYRLHDGIRVERHFIVIVNIPPIPVNLGMFDCPLGDIVYSSKNNITKEFVDDQIKACNAHFRALFSQTS